MRLIGAWLAGFGAAQVVLEQAGWTAEAFIVRPAAALLAYVLLGWVSRPPCRSCGWPKGSDNHRMAHDPDPRNRMWTKPEWVEYHRSGRKPSWDKSR